MTTKTEFTDDGITSEDWKRQSEAIRTVESLVNEFGGTAEQWLRSQAIGLWSYSRVTIGDVSLPVGASGGGVVSVNRHPFDPEGRVNDHPDAIRAALMEAFHIENDSTPALHP